MILCLKFISLTLSDSVATIPSLIIIVPLCKLIFKMTKSNYFFDGLVAFRRLLWFFFEKLLILCFGSFPKKTNPDAKSFSSLPKFGKHIFTTYEWLSYIMVSDRQPTTVQFLEGINCLDFITKGSGILRFSYFGQEMVTLTKVNTVKPILRCKKNVQKSLLYQFVTPWLRNGLLVSDKSIWRPRRKLLIPTMHPKIIQSYFPIFVEHSKIFSSKLEDRLDRRVDIIHLLSYLTLDVILETAMGVKMEIQKTEDSEYLDSIHTLTLCSMERLFRIWYWPYWLFKLFPLGRKYVKALHYTRNFTKKVIEERKVQLLESKLKGTEMETAEVQVCDTKKRLSFLDLILELHLSEKGFELDDVQDEVETFLFGGHDTSSQSMGWTLYLLGLHPEVLVKVQKELDDVLGTDPDIPITLEDLKNLVYLECAIKESTRLYPPVPGISRLLDEDIIIDGVTIPKGTLCNIVINAVHRDPDYYPDPEKFIPERFLPNKEKPLDPDAFLTFSAGPRGCVGYMFALLQMKVVLSTVLRRFNVTSLLPRDKIILNLGLVQTPVGDLPVKFTRR